jgi:hypothetical protein
MSNMKYFSFFLKKKKKKRKKRLNLILINMVCSFIKKLLGFSKITIILPRGFYMFIEYITTFCQFFVPKRTSCCQGGK